MAEQAFQFQQQLMFQHQMQLNQLQMASNGQLNPQFLQQQKAFQTQMFADSMMFNQMT